MNALFCLVDFHFTFNLFNLSHVVEYKYKDSICFTRIHLKHSRDIFQIVFTYFLQIQ